AARLGGWSLSFRRPAALRFHASAQRIHQIDDFCWCALFRCFDLLASLLFLQQFLKRVLVLVVKFLQSVCISTKTPRPSVLRDGADRRLRQWLRSERSCGNSC